MHKHHFQTHMFRIKTYNGKTIFLSNYQIYMMMPKKSPMSHTIPTRSIPNLPNIKKDLTESTGVVPAKDPSKVKLEESSNNVRDMSFREIVRTFFLRVFGFL